MTQKELQDVLHYNWLTGIFTWRSTRNNRVQKGTVAGHRNKEGYIKIRLNNKTYAAHRLAFLYMRGFNPKEQVDHKNRNRSDNMWLNLREVTPKINQQNTKLYSNNTSGCVGVRKIKNKYIACIARVYLGSFDSFDEAVKVRLEAEVKYNFHPNHGK